MDFSPFDLIQRLYSVSIRALVGLIGTESNYLRRIIYSEETTDPTMDASR